MKCMIILLLFGAMTVFAQSSVPPDNYEPNNSFAAAYPLDVGDSVVKNATVSGSVTFGSEHPFTYSGSDIDVDFFKVTLAQGTLLSVTAFPWLNGTSEDTLTAQWRWRLFLVDSSCTTILCGGYPLFEFAAHYSGVFYIAVTSFSGIDYPCRYGMSVSERTIIFEQFREVPAAGLQEDTGGYQMTLDFDTADVSVNITLNEKVGGRIDAKILLPDDFDTAVSTQGAIKTVWLEADPGIASSIKTADIIIPYTLADISGFSESSLSVSRLNDTTHQWMPVDYSIDTVRHQIIAHATHFSIYGVFVGSTVSVASASAVRPSVSGITTDFLPNRRCVTVHMSLQKASRADCRLYTVQGECAGKFAAFVGAGESTFLWDLGTVADGRYVCVINAGNRRLKKAFAIMR